MAISNLDSIEENITKDIIGLIAAGRIVLAGILNFFVFSSSDTPRVKHKPETPQPTTPINAPKPATPEPVAEVVPEVKEVKVS